MKLVKKYHEINFKAIFSTYVYILSKTYLYFLKQNKFNFFNNLIRKNFFDDFSVVKHKTGIIRTNFCFSTYLNIDSYSDINFHYIINHYIHYIFNHNILYMLFYTHTFMILWYNIK